MESAQNILSLALSQSVMQGEMELVQHNSQTTPGSVHYVINRFRKLPNMMVEETGMMVYNYNEDTKSGNVELVFCLEGNRYCKEKDEECFTCKFLANEADREKISLARDVLLQHIGEPLTIKELSRKAAINECY